MLQEQLASFLADRIPADQGFCLGLSGGRDSVVLLHALVACGFQPRLAALHVHHGLSPHADLWASHCTSLCAQLRVPLTVTRVQVAPDSGKGLEAAARMARYEAFAAVPEPDILLAHHQGDQAETLLFNLLRGSGVAGAKGMRDERRAGDKRILRPLLALPTEQIRSYAEQMGVQWIEDESNADTHYARNYLRHEVMPVLVERFPACETQLSKAAAHFAEAEDLLVELARLDWVSCSQEGALRLAALRALSPARIRNLLRWHLRCIAWRVPSAACLDEFVRQLCDAGPDGRPRLELPDGELRVRRGILEFGE